MPPLPSTPAPRDTHTVSASHCCLLIRVCTYRLGAHPIAVASFISTNYIDTDYASIYCHPVQCLSLRLPTYLFWWREKGDHKPTHETRLFSVCLSPVSPLPVPLATQKPSQISGLCRTSAAWGLSQAVSSAQNIPMSSPSFFLATVYLFFKPQIVMT